jgi:hypothetical protein
MRYLDHVLSARATSKRDAAQACATSCRADWYQAHWADRVSLVRAGELSFANTALGGSARASPSPASPPAAAIASMIDDPHSTETAESEADRVRATRIFRESVTTRLNDPRHDAIVIIMHRLHDPGSSPARRSTP